MASARGLRGYTENLNGLVSTFRAERDRIRRDYRLPSEGKEFAIEEARARFTEQATELVHLVLGEPGIGGLVGGTLWAAMKESQAALRAAYDRADDGTDWARLAYERQRVPQVLARYANSAELEHALPTLGTYTRRALADSADAVRARFPNELAVGHLIAELQREQQDAIDAATASAREEAAGIVDAGVAFVQAARNAAIETDVNARPLGDVLRHVTLEEIVDPLPGGGVRYRLSNREAAPIDVAASGRMSFGGEPPNA